MKNKSGRPNQRITEHTYDSGVNADSPCIEVPSLQRSPILSGRHDVGAQISTDDGLWRTPFGCGLSTYSFQWKHDAGTPIQGAPDAATYRIRSTDVGHSIFVTVSACNEAGCGTADSNALTILPPPPPPNVCLDPPVLTRAPVLSGTAEVGARISTDDGLWRVPRGCTTPAYSYLWRYGDGAPIQGAPDASLYIIRSSDAGHSIFVTVSACNEAGCTTVDSNALTVPSPPPPPPGEEPVTIPLAVLWRTKSGDKDYMTTSSPTERDDDGSSNAIFYIPRNDVPGAAPLYRHYKIAIPDYKDSTNLIENGYHNEVTLGYGWASNTATPGLRPLVDAYNPRTKDHATIKPDENIAGHSDKVPIPGCFGYPRFNNQAQRNLAISGLETTIESNGVCGGVVWKWTWNNMQFINNRDYGREMQAALFYHKIPESKCGGTWKNNPTEAGDGRFVQQGKPGNSHGSPLSQPMVNSADGRIQVTRAIPLEWCPGNIGGDEDHPVLYRDMIIGKDIEMDFMGLTNVIRYTTYLSTSVAIGDAVFAIPTCYLRANFNSFFSYHADAPTAQRLQPRVPPALPFCPAPPNHVGWGSTNPPYPGEPPRQINYGGVIISDRLRRYAMGIYGVDRGFGGSVSVFTLWDWLCPGSREFGEKSDSTTTVTAAYAGPIPAGVSTFRTYIICGTLAQVTERMDQLYSMGIK
jgi:hypothetical protein